MHRLKSWSANLLVVFGSIAITYLVCELLFFRVVLPRLPLNVRTHLPELADVLVQTSKSGYLPHDYIALLGDSYADGVGDWLLAANNNRAKPFHSAHVIHSLTGTDVVSFGRGPAGSAEGLVQRPARVFAVSECYLFPSIDQPKRMFYYFYEGNDLEDNLEFMARARRGDGQSSPDPIRRRLAGYAEASPWRCHRHFGDTLMRMATFAAEFYLLKKDVYRPSKIPGPQLTIAGGTLRAAPLQAPALNLSADDIREALAVFDPSLAWLRSRWPDVPVTVVYIPSPLTIYRDAITDKLKVHTPFGPKGLSVAYADPDGGSLAEFAASRSDQICGSIRAMSLRHGAAFMDTRPALRTAALEQPIHGPIDWGHLNEAGYRLLGKLVADVTRGGPVADDCGSGATASSGAGKTPN
jgi:hypothetical protein